MSRFIQLHAITSYPPSNLNRDDLGRPKSAVVGGVQRLRISSQALKRAWRSSEIFRTVFGEFGESSLGRRTRRMGLEWIAPRLQAAGIETADAQKWSREIQLALGDSETVTEAPLLNRELVFFRPAEEQRLKSFIDALIAHLRENSTSESIKAMLQAIQKRDHAREKKKARTTYRAEMGKLLLVRKDTTVDLAMFGRMLAANPTFNVEAAVQVAHAITVHRAAIEDDYFTAVDDLNRGDEDRGAGHIGETGFGAGVYYLYICINRGLLDENLGGDTALRDRALAAILEALTQVAPTGKQNSFASRAYASCVLAEKGSQQPRSLAAAFLRPVINHGGDDDVAREAIVALLKKRASFEQMYGPGSDGWRAAAEGEYWSLFKDECPVGSLEDLVKFVQVE